MDTINSVATSISNTIFGNGNQSHEEPQSGVQGDTSKGEPFDGGNMETKNEEGKAGPAETHDSSADHGDSTKAQNDVRDPSDPETKPDSAAASGNVDDTGDGPKDAPKVEGPGPKPVAEVARERGGDAGNIGKNVNGDGGGDGDDHAGQDDEDEDGPQKTSHGEGTGEKYVRSTGLKADGGDFDATKPGAGREADRLLEEKGIRHGGDNQPKPRTSPSPGQKEKKNPLSKIKAKLHRTSAS